MKAKPNEISITRVYDAPVELVWEAWADPEQAAKWWGPRGFTITTHSKDLRVGGHWKYTMHGPDGVDYPNRTLYYEVEKYKKLVYDHGGTEDTPPLFRVTVLFADEYGKTKMEMIMSFPDEDIAKNMKQFIKDAGGNATWDRLAEYLGDKINGKDSFVINRTFDASLETVYGMWTNPKHVVNWLPPTGFTMEYLHAQIGPGGSSFYKMTNGEITMYGKANYLEVTSTKIVYTQIFCDQDGNISRHPLAPTWPETMITTVTLSPEESNKTRVTIYSEVYGDATDAEREVFHNAKADMTLGWTGSFDKLENYLQ